MSSKKYGECRWLLNAIDKAGSISLSDINTQWVKEDEFSGGEELSRKTFQRHRDAIEQIVGIKIECDLEDHYKYYITHPEDLGSVRIGQWILEHLALGELLQDYKALHRRILLEDVPTSYTCLRLIVEAMKRSRMIYFSYHAYGSMRQSDVMIAPYCLKQYRQRLYLLGRKGSDGFVTYALERMRNLHMTKEKFAFDRNFDAAGYFEDIIGIVKDEKEKVMEVILRAYDKEPYYLRDVPLHKSQVEIGTGENYTDFKYTMRFNLELMGWILQRSDRVKVLSPASLVGRISELILKMKDNYGL